MYKNWTSPSQVPDAEESKIMEISDLSDMESGKKLVDSGTKLVESGTKLVESDLIIWKKALEDSKCENILLKQEIEELKSKVNNIKY